MMGRYSCLVKIYFLKQYHENINSPDTKPLPNGLLIQALPELWSKQSYENWGLILGLMPITKMNQKANKQNVF